MSISSGDDLTEHNKTMVTDGKLYVELMGFTYVISKDIIPAGDTSRISEIFQSAETSTPVSLYRSRASFEAIIQYFVTGELHIPKSICPGEFKTEMEFWKVDLRKLSKCCRLRMIIHLQNVRNMETYSKRENGNTRKDSIQSIRKMSRFVYLHTLLSDAIDQKSNSIPAKVYRSLLTIMVLVSVFLIAFSSLPEVRRTTALPEVKNDQSSQSSIPFTEEKFHHQPQSIVQNDNLSQMRTEMLNLDDNYTVLFEDFKHTRTKFPCSVARFMNCTDIKIYMNETGNQICSAFHGILQNMSLSVNDADILFGITQQFCTDLTMAPSPEVRNLTDVKSYLASNDTNVECGESLCSVWESWENTTSMMVSLCETKNKTNLQKSVNKLCNEISNAVSIPVIYREGMISYPFNELIEEKLPSVTTLIDSDNLGLLYFEFILSAFFSIDYCIRFCFSPNKLRFPISPLNVIDLFALLAGYLRYILYSFDVEMETARFDLFLYLQIFRIFRLFRPLQSVCAFRIFVYSLQKGRNELFIIILFTLIGMIVFSNLLYFVEDVSKIPSIPEAWWWSIVTMTTVGYGDFYPVTVSGKIIGGACALYGVIIYALTIPMFVNTFNDIYRYELVERQIEDCKSNTPEGVTNSAA